MLRRSYERRQFYIQMLLCFLAFVAIFLAVFAFVYYRTTARMKKVAIDESLTYMQRGAGEIDDRFLALYDDFAKIPSLNEFGALARVGGNVLAPPTYSQMLSMQERLDEMCSFDNTVTDMMLFFDAGENSFAISPKYVVHDFKTYYEQGLMRCGDISYDAFAALVRGNANNRFSINKYTDQVPFTSRVVTAKTPMGSKFMFIYKFVIANKRCDVYGVLFLDPNAIKEKLSEGKGGYFAITNGPALLSSTNSSVPLPKEKFETKYVPEEHATYLSVVSGKLNLSYYSSVDDKSITEQVSNFSTLLYILLGIFLFLSVCVLILLAIYVVGPVQKLYNRVIEARLTGKRRQWNIIRVMSSEVDAMSIDNSLFNTRLSAWKPILKTNLIGRLLKGEYFTDDEKELVLSLMGFAEKGYEEWQVAVISEISPKTGVENEAAEQLGNKVWAYFPEAVICVLDNYRVAVLVGVSNLIEQSSQTQPTTFEKGCTLALEELNHTEGKSYAIGIGSPYRELFDVRHSFREADRALREAMLWKRITVLPYRNIQEQYSEYSISYADIEKIHNYLLAGDSGQALSLLKRLSEKNFTTTGENLQYYHSCKQFYFEILGVLMRIAAHKDISPVLGSLMEYPENMRPDQMPEKFTQAFEFTAEALRYSKHTPIHDLYSDMLNFIDRNYMDSGMSLKMLSQEFSFSEPYLSLCFKNEAGMNFFSYLENLRLSQAERILIETEMPVHKIAESVGYNTPNTFYKAFKRKHGITPSAWQEQQKKSREN